MWWWLLICLFIVFIILVSVDRCFHDKVFEKIPGPKGIFLLRNGMDFLMDPVSLFYYFRKLTKEHKNLYKIQLGPKKLVFIHDPEDVETIISGSRNTSKGFPYKFLKPWLKEGLLISDGAKWHQRRKILTPAFHFKILRYFSKVLQGNSNKLVKQLRKELNQSETQISTYIADFTLNSICETAMGTKLDEQASAFGNHYKDAIHNLGQLVVHRCQRVWMYADSMFNLTAVGRQQKKILNLLTSFRESVVNKRREANNNDGKSHFTFKEGIEDDDDTENSRFEEKILDDVGKKRLAMLDLLLQAEKEGIIDANGIGEEVDTFMFEGHDTTATALQFTFMLLANNQEAQNKVVEECTKIFGTSEREATTSDLAQMKYLECCIKESLRLYPPVFFILRKIDHSMKLKSYEIPGGIDCGVLIFELQRRADQFEEPDEFRPERFLKEPTWHQYSYLPFSVGQRNCIGQKFAMMEMKIFLSTVLRRYKLLPVTRPEDVVFIIDFILRSTKPIYVKIQSRY